MNSALPLTQPSGTHTDMRYIIEFLLPGTIVVIVALLLFRNRTQAPTQNAAGQTPDASGTLSTGTFVLILIVGAAFTVALVYALHSNGP